jgi:hypothetical protein
VADQLRLDLIDSYFWAYSRMNRIMRGICRVISINVMSMRFEDRRTESSQLCCI